MSLIRTCASHSDVEAAAMRLIITLKESDRNRRVLSLRSMFVNVVGRVQT